MSALPDVHISTSVRHVTEGDAFAYTVVLTHAPGMREDETIDLMNDEVRIYLTSSQEVYQQDDSTTSTPFEQRVGHRTQLEINTDIASVTLVGDLVTGQVVKTAPAGANNGRASIENGDGSVQDSHMGPVPYVYVAYSTKNPTQASPRIDVTSTYYGGATVHASLATWANYKVVCPVCTHEAYCTQLESVIPGTAFAIGGADRISGGGTGVTDDNRDTETLAAFDGCLDILYNGFAPVYDRCSENGAAIRASAGASAGTYTTEVYVGYMVHSAADPTAAALSVLLGEQEVQAATTITADPTSATVVGFTGNDPSDAGISGYTGKPNGPAPGIPFGNAAYQRFGCYPVVADFDGMHGYTSSASATDVLQAATTPMLKRVPMGGEDPKWLQHVECWDKLNGVWQDCAGKLEDVPRDGTEPVAADVCKASTISGTVFDPTAATPTDWANCKSGLSDYRIRADGSPVTRDVPRIDNYCRYCDKPGLMCDTDGDMLDANRVYGTIHVFGHGGAAAEVDPVIDTLDYTSTEATGGAGINMLYGRECVKDTVNGGDTAPNVRNWQNIGYASGPSWRGDLSSGAQLVFDSTNWDTAQTVVVTARDDKVYEPQVFGRGQDAYVHHYVVAQDINLQHTYYEDIDVNDVVVSITDNDPAYVVEEFAGGASTNDDATLTTAGIAPTEGEVAADRPQIKLKLASEPMYDVTVYVQSGDFIAADGTTVQPDDEQVIFQDTAQYAVCFDAVNGLRSVTGTTANVGTVVATANAVGGSQADDCSKQHLDVDDIGSSNGDYTSGADTKRQGWDGRSSVHACDPNGVYVRPEEYKDSTYDYETGVPGLPTGWVCPSLNTEATCTAADAASGCAWQSAYNTWVVSTQPAVGVCIGWDDKKVGNTQTNDAASPFQYTNTHDGTHYPIEIAAADQATCEDTANHWNGLTAGNVNGDADGCTSSVGAVLPNLKSEHQCLKTGNRWIVKGGGSGDGTGAGEGFCKDIHGLFLSETASTPWDTKANCEYHATAVDLANVYDASTATTDTSRGHCVDSMVGRSPDTIGKGRATKSMDIVCAQHPADAACLKVEGCYWDASILEDAAEWPITTTGMCKAEKLGFDCNSYLVFTSTNWNVLQTLDVIAVQDDEDETAAASGTDASSIGYLYTSRDWYYNSIGSELLSSQNAGYTGEALWSPGTPDTAASNLKLSMFDTRFGLHINRYPWTKGDAELGACTGTVTSTTLPCGDTEAFLASGVVADCPTADGCTFGAGRLAAGVIQEIGPAARTSVQNGLVATAESCISTDISLATDCSAPAGAADGDGDGYLSHAEIETARAACVAVTGCHYTAPQVGVVADADVSTLSPVVDYRVQGQVYKADGKHVHNEYGVSTWVDYLTQTVALHQGAQVTTLGGHYDEPDGYLDEPHYGFMVAAPHTTMSAKNKVCLAASFPSAEQILTFDPASYANSGATCGGTNNIVDTNLRQVLISRQSCQATEGRRFYHKNFNHQKNPTDLEWNGHLRTYTEMPAADTQSSSTRYEFNSFGTHHRTEAPSKLPVTLGLFTGDATATSLINTETVAPGDLWTANYLLESEAALYGAGSMLGMSMPVCPFTIVLESSPLEGATVVVKVFEDSELVDLRDNELYFYEEPTFRNGVISEAECEGHFPGSDWISDHDGGSCFIQNVPYVVGAPTTPSGLRFKPRGGKKIDVMFTDQDWDVPRRITAIALNDDVDEPQETRKIYFDTAPCTGYNHNPGTGHTGSNHGTPSGGEACIEDPLYNDANIYTANYPAGVPGTGNTDYIEVTVVDDDIADLVVLCGDNAGGAADDLDLTGGASRATTYVDSCTDGNTGEVGCKALAGCVWTGTACAFDYEDDEMFIGSYDDSHPHNRWDEQIERVGADAEDGMSYSRFGGGISTFFDGITGLSGESDCPNCGYVSIITAGDTNDNDEALMNRERCITRSTEHLSKLVEESVYPLPSFITGEVHGQSALAVPGSGNNAVVAYKTEEGCYPDTTQTWVSYDPYSDTYCQSANTAEAYGPHCGAHHDATGPVTTDHVTITDHVRGFKGVGPAITEAADSYVCTIHSRECKDLNGGTTDEATMENSEDSACEYGDFKVRLNSSPGVKRVRRQYIGTTDTDTEEEVVYIVITPDQTPQTSFEPKSVTFTHAGGNVDGADTYRWDEPATIKVVPIDDAVDERMGVIVDFTAFTITQSHKYDEYWKYTTPYMDTTESSFNSLGYAGEGAGMNTGAMCEWATSANVVNGNAGWSFGTGCPAAPDRRNSAATAYRHTIRTIHTMDNDFSGVRIESSPTNSAKDDMATYNPGGGAQGFSTSTELPACTSGECVADGAQMVDSTNKNYYEHLPTPLVVTEGSTFTYYTIQLDTQPTKIQRQSGTDPNTALIFTPDSDLAAGSRVCHDVSPYNWDTATCTWNMGGDGVDVTALTNALTATDFSTEAKCDDLDNDGNLYDGPEHGEFFADWTDRTRPDACGSVEPKQDYWVDVTVAQTVHVDLSVPATCPAGEAAPWGGGKAKSAGWTAAQRHPRFPFNGKSGGNGPSSATDSYRPFDELVDAPSSMDGYLSTCGGWQRDATYRFDATNWNVPQYVYVYAHNDKDSHDIKNQDIAGVQPDPTQHVAHGGNEQTDSSVGHDPTPNLDSDGRTGTGATGSVVGDYGVTEGNYICEDHNTDQATCEARPGCLWDTPDCIWGGSRPEYFDRSTAKKAETYTTVLRHYVETQDTLDNMQGNGFVQWNKHGGLYTYGNIERFPFGINRYSGAPEYGKTDETGSSTWGYSKYESLYGYGFYKDGLWTTEGCCSTAMGGNWGTTTGGVDVWGTSGPASPTTVAGVGSWGGIGGTDTNELGNEFMWDANSDLPATSYATAALDQCRFAVSQRDLDTYSQRLLSGQAANLGSNDAGDRWRGPGEFTRGTSQIDDVTGSTEKASLVPPNAAGDCYEQVSGNKLPRPYFRQLRSPAGGRTDAPVAGGCNKWDGDAVNCPLEAGCVWEGGWDVAGNVAGTTTKCGFDGSFWEGVPDGAFCTPVSNDQFCTPRFATSYQTNVESEYTLGARRSSDRSTGDALKFPPLNVWIAIVDNDAQRELTTTEKDNLRASCKQTSMFQFADAKGAGSALMNGVTSSKWLTDYNCVPDESNRLDAGVLPGYPVDTSAPPVATDVAGSSQAGTAAPSGLTPNLGVGTGAVGTARVDGGAHLCTAAQVYCPSGAAAQASICQTTDCSGCTGFTVEPNAGDISGVADICCADTGCKVNAASLCPAAQVFCPAGSSAGAAASTCQDTDCNACTGFVTEPNGGNISPAGDTCGV